MYCWRGENRKNLENPCSFQRCNAISLLHLLAVTNPGTLPLPPITTELGQKSKGFMAPTIISGPTILVLVNPSSACKERSKHLALTIRTQRLYLQNMNEWPSGKTLVVWSFHRGDSRQQDWTLNVFQAHPPLSSSQKVGVVASYGFCPVFSHVHWSVVAS